MRRIVVALAAVAFSATVIPPAQASGPQRLLYSSDWSGTSQFYAADPTAVDETGQVTVGRAPACGTAECGFRALVPSPDGRFLLYSDWTECGTEAQRPTLFVSRADGTHRRALAHVRSGPLCGNNIDAAWERDSRRIAYRIGTSIHVVRFDGRNDHVIGRGDRFAWSPVGGSIAYTTPAVAPDRGSIWVARNGHRRMLARVADGQFAWSPNGRWIEYAFPKSADEGALVIVHPDGTGRRTMRAHGGISAVPWSADSRYLVAETGAGLVVLNIATQEITALSGDPLAWRPSGHELAIQVSGGVSLYDAKTNQTRLLTADRAGEFTWSPTGRLYAYVSSSVLRSYPYAKGDLKVANVSGGVRTLVRAGGNFGGHIRDLVWTRPPPGTNYQRAAARVVADVADSGVTAPWDITRVAADGNRVAYVSCGHVFVWAPSQRSVAQTEPDTSLAPRCTTPGNYLAFWLYSLALSGDRVAFGTRLGNAGQSWALYSVSATKPSQFNVLGSAGSANGCPVGSDGLGDLAGAGDLLVFSVWKDDLGCPARTLEQSIARVDGSGCPCPTIATSPGPLVPFDVDRGRIAAGGENATVVFDASGTQITSVPVSPLAAQLAGSQLVVLGQGHLLVHDARTGAQLHSWPLPDVPSGGECGSPHSGTWECRSARLLLEDASHGLAAYVVEGQVHVLRLDNGAHAAVAKGTLARFTEDGLVYVDGRTLHLVPYADLPVRGS